MSEGIIPFQTPRSEQKNYSKKSSLNRIDTLPIRSDRVQFLKRHKIKIQKYYEKVVQIFSMAIDLKFSKRKQ